MLLSLFPMCDRGKQRCAAARIVARPSHPVHSLSAVPTLGGSHLTVLFRQLCKPTAQMTYQPASGRRKRAKMAQVFFLKISPMEILTVLGA
jgi:hypothetical protein